MPLWIRSTMGSTPWGHQPQTFSGKHRRNFMACHTFQILWVLHFDPVVCYWVVQLVSLSEWVCHGHLPFTEFEIPTCRSRFPTEKCWKLPGPFSISNHPFTCAYFLPVSSVFLDSWKGRRWKWSLELVCILCCYFPIMEKMVSGVRWMWLSAPYHFHCKGNWHLLSTNLYQGL